MGSRKEGNADQKAKGLDGNNMLTPEGRKMKAAEKQLGKATTAASQHKGISGSTYLDQYNKLKDTKNKTKNQLSSLASMNEQMGYNPTTGMGIMGSLNYNTIGAGADIANLMNNPLVKIAGMATNPLGFAGSMLGKNLYQNFTDEDKNTGFLNAASKTAQDVTPFDTNRITDFLGNIFRQEEEEADYVGSDVINTVDPIKIIDEKKEISKLLSNNDGNGFGYIGDAIDTTTEQYRPNEIFDPILGFIKPAYDVAKNFYNQATTELTDIQKNSNPVLNSKITPNNIDQYQNNVEQEKLGVDMFQTGEGEPYQQFFNDSYSSPLDLSKFPRPVETNDNMDRFQGNNDGNTTVYEGNPNFDPGVVTTSLPFTGYGTINPGANYNQLYGFTAANGGRVPPMSGPTSNGIGTLYKQK